MNFARHDGDIPGSSGQRNGSSQIRRFRKTPRHITGAASMYKVMCGINRYDCNIVSSVKLALTVTYAQPCLIATQVDKYFGLRHCKNGTGKSASCVRHLRGN